LMLATSERVGNFNSANGIRRDTETGELKNDGKKHIGISGLRKSNLSFNKDGVVLKYTGKSGTDHEKQITDQKIVKQLKELSKRNKDFIFTTTDGKTIKPERVNDYLSNYDITSKDIRTYNINKYVIKELKRSIPKEEKDRKKRFLDVIRKVASEIEHGESQTRKNYLNDVVEPNYVEKGKVVDIDDF